MLELLHERPGLPAYDVPAGLAERYGGTIGFEHPRLIANFVGSIDGVVAIDSVRSAPSFISGKDEHDRFVMALLRACAGAVLIGANTLRAEPDHRWTPQHIFPEAAGDLAGLRSALGLEPEPQLVVVTGSGELDPEVSALRGAVILTSAEGAREVARRRVPASEVTEIGGGGELDARSIVAVLGGHDVVLSEAGPTLTAQLISAGLLDELFLTVSPVVIGRTEEDRRLGFAEGDDLLASAPPAAELLSLRRAGSYLFARYVFARG